MSTKRKLVVEGSARLDLLEIRQWYDEQGPGLSKRFTADFVQTLKRVERNPESFSVRFEDVRKAHFDIFPYGIFYRIEPSIVRVVAVIADARDPDMVEEKATGVR